MLLKRKVFNSDATKISVVYGIEKTLAPACQNLAVAPEQVTLWASVSWPSTRVIRSVIAKSCFNLEIISTHQMFK